MLQAFFLTFALIAAIGAQNAFVLRQALGRQRYLLDVLLICIFCDFALIGLGVFGLGRVLGEQPGLTVALALFGAAFLFYYGYQSLRRAFSAADALQAQGELLTRRPRLWLQTLAITLLNPHVYLDTVLFLGSYAATLPRSAHPAFLFGAVSASAAWFLLLGYGARRFAFLFQSPRSWRILEAVVGVIMFWIGGGLLLFIFRLWSAHP